jgi:hypothetical protein
MHGMGLSCTYIVYKSCPSWIWQDPESTCIHCMFMQYVLQLIVFCSMQFLSLDLGILLFSRALLRLTVPPYTTIEKDQYERIRRLELIVFHNNLHMWYTVVYIEHRWNRGIIESFISVVKRNI